VGEGNVGYVRMAHRVFRQWQGGAEGAEQRYGTDATTQQVGNQTSKTGQPAPAKLARQLRCAALSSDHA
jgi:hypothetical protein